MTGEGVGEEGMWGVQWSEGGDRKAGCGASRAFKDDAEGSRERVVMRVKWIGMGVEEGFRRSLTPWRGVVPF